MSSTKYWAFALNSGLRLRERLDARGIDVRDKWDCNDVTFGGSVWFHGAEFGGSALFRRAEFNKTVRFKGAEFGSAVQFIEAKFGDVAGFAETKFEKGTGFTEAEFDWHARFQETKFEAGANCQEAEFNKTVRVKGAEFGGTARFSGTKFSGTAEFNGAEFEEGATFAFGGWYPVSQFQSDVDFSDVTANDSLRFVDEYDSPPGRPYTFLGEVDFRGAEIPNAEFSEVSFCEAPTFENADLTRADLSDSWLEGTTFKGADLTRADLSESKVLDADFNDALLEQVSLYGTVLTNARLYGARMGNAHVSDHTDFGVRNQIGKKRSSLLPFHGPWPGVRYDPRNPDYDEYVDDEASENAEGSENISDLTRAVAVYAEIERVAETNADSELASRCYLWRKDMQRRRYWSNEGRGNRSESLQWLRSMLTNIFVRYGESPWRVSGISGLVIIGCAVLYYAFDLIEYSTSPSQSALFSVLGLTPPDSVTFLDALYFSTLTFSTLGMGTFHPKGQVGRGVAILETLSGVVLLALLVFVFGRRATR